jgi:hypothetical protein
MPEYVVRRRRENDRSKEPEYNIASESGSSLLALGTQSPRGHRLHDKLLEAKLGSLAHGLVTHAAAAHLGVLVPHDAVDDACAKGGGSDAGALGADPGGGIISELVSGLGAGLEGDAGGRAEGGVGGDLLGAGSRLAPAAVLGSRVAGRGC